MVIIRYIRESFCFERYTTWYHITAMNTQREKRAIPTAFFLSGGGKKKKTTATRQNGKCLKGAKRVYMRT